MNYVPFFPLHIALQSGYRQVPFHSEGKMGLHFVLDASQNILELGSFRPSSKQISNLLIPHLLGTYGCRSRSQKQVYQDLVVDMTTYSFARSRQHLEPSFCWNWMKKKFSPLTDDLIFPRDTASHVPRRDVQWWGIMPTDSQIDWRW